MSQVRKEQLSSYRKRLDYAVSTAMVLRFVVNIPLISILSASYSDTSPIFQWYLMCTIFITMIAMAMYVFLMRQTEDLVEIEDFYLTEKEQAFCVLYFIQEFLTSLGIIFMGIYLYSTELFVCGAVSTVLFVFCAFVVFSNMNKLIKNF